MKKLFYLGTLFGSCLSRHGSNETFQSAKHSRTDYLRTGADGPQQRARQSATEGRMVRKSRSRARENTRDRTVRQGYADVPPDTNSNRTEQLARQETQVRTVRRPGVDGPPLEAKTAPRASAQARCRTVRRQGVDGPPSDKQKLNRTESRFQTGHEFENQPNEL
jgi:hypothetical protein